MVSTAKSNVEAGNKGVKKRKVQQRTLPLRYLILIIIVATFIRMLFNFLPCYNIDMGGYRNWAGYLGGDGSRFSDFYRDVHCVYGPFYMYFLWGTGKLMNMPVVGSLGPEFLVKVWAVFSDIIGGLLIYLIGRKYNKEKLGLAIGLLYAFNPAVFFNSSVWGQFDSFTATLMLAVVYLFNLRKSNAAVFVYAVAALTKPQSIALLPLVVILYFRDFPWKKYGEFIRSRDKGALKHACVETIIKLGITAAGCLLIYTVLVLPFYKGTPFYTLNELQIFGNSSQGNLAANKSITASGTEDSTGSRYLPANTVDGKEDTFWSSGRTHSQWLYVDLERSYEINNVVLGWNWEYAKGYDIKVSDDAKEWKTVYSEIKGNGNMDKATFDVVKARYVKIDLIKRPFPYSVVKVNENSGFVTKTAYNIVDFYSWLLHQYTNSLNDYPYATANAFNFWMLLGKQTVTDKEILGLGLSSGTWGYVLLLVISVFATILLLIRKRSVLALYYAGYFLTLGVFTFGTKMHERYMLPAITFAMICILWDKRMIIPTVLLSACSLGNQWYVYQAGNIDSHAPWIAVNDTFGMAVSWVTVLVAILSVAYIIWLTGRDKNSKKVQAATKGMT